MKRSEMVWLIESQLYMAGIHHDAKLDAEDILNELEKAGMLPPHNMCNLEKLNQSQVDLLMKGFKWEPEDEKSD